jgi:CheY-like chemotaxis protein
MERTPKAVLSSGGFPSPPRTPGAGCAAAGPLRVLIAEDDGPMRDLHIRWLRESGCDVTPCAGGLQLRTRLQMSVLSDELPAFDLLISDLSLRRGGALDALDEFLDCEGVPPAILLTVLGDRRSLRAAHRLGAASVLEEPLDKRRLLAEIHRLREAEATHTPLRSQPR